MSFFLRFYFIFGACFAMGIYSSAVFREVLDELPSELRPGVGILVMSIVAFAWPVFVALMVAATLWAVFSGESDSDEGEPPCPE